MPSSSICGMVGSGGGGCCPWAGAVGGRRDGEQFDVRHGLQALMNLQPGGAGLAVDEDSGHGAIFLAKDGCATGSVPGARACHGLWTGLRIGHFSMIQSSVAQPHPPPDRPMPHHPAARPLSMAMDDGCQRVTTTLL